VKGATGQESSTSRTRRKKYVSSVMRHIDRLEKRINEMQRELDDLRNKIRLL
jgi:hypothetical protein